jgi:hypothetical protein
MQAISFVLNNFRKSNLTISKKGGYFQHSRLERIHRPLSANSNLYNILGRRSSTRMDEWEVERH